jgi:phosphoribosylformimino-5-aminoimidazole carboxamide ribonucleotide (ProFAR) isomerase
VAALAALAPDGVEGAILGKALYTGALTLPDALAAAAGQVPLG